MQSLTVVLVTMCVGYISAEKPIVHLDPDKMGDIMQSLMSCLMEEPLDGEVLLQLRNGDKPKNVDEKKLQKFVYCSFIKSGYGKKNGHIRVEKALDLYPKNVDRDKIKKAMEECNSKDGKEPAETALNFMKCFREKSPVKVVL